MSVLPTLSPRKKPFLLRALAGCLDFATVFFVGGYAIGLATGQMDGGAFHLHGCATLVLVVVYFLYFYFGLDVLNGTIWQRILRAR